MLLKWFLLNFSTIKYSLWFREVPRERAVKNFALKKKYTTMWMYLRNLKALYFLMKINLPFHCHLNNWGCNNFLRVFDSAKMKNWFSHWKLSGDCNVRSGFFTCWTLFSYFTLCWCSLSVSVSLTFWENRVFWKLKKKGRKNTVLECTANTSKRLCNNCRFGDIILLYDSSSHARDL